MERHHLVDEYRGLDREHSDRMRADIAVRANDLR